MRGVIYGTNQLLLTLKIWHFPTKLSLTTGKEHVKSTFKKVSYQPPLEPGLPPRLYKFYRQLPSGLPHPTRPAFTHFSFPSATHLQGTYWHSQWHSSFNEHMPSLSLFLHRVSPTQPLRLPPPAHATTLTSEVAMVVTPPILPLLGEISPSKPCCFLPQSPPVSLKS